MCVTKQSCQDFTPPIIVTPSFPYKVSLSCKVNRKSCRSSSRRQVLPAVVSRAAALPLPAGDSWAESNLVDPLFQQFESQREELSLQMILVPCRQTRQLDPIFGPGQKNGIPGICDGNLLFLICCKFVNQLLISICCIKLHRTEFIAFLSYQWLKGFVVIVIQGLC